MQTRRFTSLTILVTFAVVGCRPQTPVRNYVTDLEKEEVVSSEVLRSSLGIPFDWSAPSEWKRAANDQFSTVAWELKSSGDTKPRITVSSVSIGMGLQAQVVRWRRQIEGPESDDPMAGTESLDLDGTPATWVDLAGEQEAILGLMIPQRSQLWVFKFRGSQKDISEHRSAFRAFCESVRVVSG